MASCGIFGTTKYKKLSAKEKYCIYHKIYFSVFMDNIDTFYTFGKSGFDQYCISILHNIKATEEIKIIKLIRKDEEYSFTDSRYDDILMLPVKRNDLLAQQIAEFCDLIIFDKVANATYTSTMYKHFCANRSAYAKHLHFWIMKEQAQYTK